MANFKSFAELTAFLNGDEQIKWLAKSAFDTGWDAALDEAIALTRQASFQPYRNAGEAVAAMDTLAADLERLTGAKKPNG